MDAISPGADQYAQAVAAAAAGGFGGPGVRMATGADGDCYFALVIPTSSDSRIYRCDDTGALNFVQLGAIAPYMVNAGDTVRLEAQGTTLTLKVNGGTVHTQTDATYASGRGGLFIWASTIAGDEWDDFGSGDLPVVTPKEPALERLARGLHRGLARGAA